MSQVAAAPTAPPRHPRPPFEAILDWVLDSPLHRLLSGSLALVRYIGHRSGIEHRFPVRYALAGDDYVVLVGHARRRRWWRNFTSNRPISLVVRGRDVPGSGAVVMAGDLDYDRLAGAYVRRFPGAAHRLAEEPGVFVRIEPLRL